MIQHAHEFWVRATRSPGAPRRRWHNLATTIDREADSLRDTSDSELRRLGDALRYRSLSGERLLSLLADAFPLVVETARRQLGLRPFRVQILGGIALAHGGIAELQTGEGKTLTATMPLFLQALRGDPVHLATANDYLAQRDADWMRPVFESLGLTVAAITAELSPAERRAAYACDITYGTAREFGFDFLRDRLLNRGGAEADSGSLDLMPFSLPRPNGDDPTTRAMQRSPRAFLLVDEADSLLIDEARTPLIISSPSDNQADQAALVRWCAESASQFHEPELVFRIEESKTYELTPAGYRLLRSLIKPAALNSFAMSDLADAMLKAIYVDRQLERDVDYVVEDGTVLIVDEYTGRVARGRKWRDGVHQAVEAKEQLEQTPTTVHTARITVQELVALYDHVAGMTGTACSAAYEFWRVYGLPVCRIPTNRPVQREYWPQRALPDNATRWQAVADEVADVQKTGRPILVGTRTIAKSELLSAELTNRSIPHEVLNARHHASEAAIVAEAGQPERVTVATNMAGRGTDITLQGNAAERGGLHVICSEPHAAARIDRQLAGRCSRQGDPGSFRQFLSLEDEVVRDALGEDESLAQQTRLAGRSNDELATVVKKAQLTVERRHVHERSLLLERARRQRRQLDQLGLDPWLDSV